MSWLLRLWRVKWGLARLGVAAFLLWVVAADTQARLARMALAALPNFDYAGEVRSLRLQGRYGEALVVATAGKDAVGADRLSAEWAAIDAEERAANEEQASWLRKIKEVGLGAVSGQGNSLEALVGAIAADFFVLGDLRDLVIQGGKEMLDNDGDEVVLLLSVAGIVTTLGPEIDWVPSVLKVAKKSGGMSKGLAEFVTTAIKARDAEKLKPLLRDTRKIAEHASPGGAARLLKHAEDPADVARIARFVERESSGAFALRVTGKSGARVVKEAGEAGEKLVVAAACKGRAGTRFLDSPAARAMLRPHPIVGLLKGVWKGNAAKLVERVLDRMDSRTWWTLPMLVAWTLLELGLLARSWCGIAAGSRVKKRDRVGEGRA